MIGKINTLDTERPVTVQHYYRLRRAVEEVQQVRGCMWCCSAGSISLTTTPKVVAVVDSGENVCFDAVVYMASAGSNAITLDVGGIPTTYELSGNSGMFVVRLFSGDRGGTVTAKIKNTTPAVSLLGLSAWRYFPDVVDIPTWQRVPAVAGLWRELAERLNLTLVSYRPFIAGWADGTGYNLGAKSTNIWHPRAPVQYADEVFSLRHNHRLQVFGSRSAGGSVNFTLTPAIDGSAVSFGLSGGGTKADCELEAAGRSYGTTTAPGATLSGYRGEGVTCTISALRLLAHPASDGSGRDDFCSQSALGELVPSAVVSADALTEVFRCAHYAGIGGYMPPLATFTPPGGYTTSLTTSYANMAYGVFPYWAEGESSLPTVIFAVIKNNSAASRVVRLRLACGSSSYIASQTVAAGATAATQWGVGELSVTAGKPVILAVAADAAMSATIYHIGAHVGKGETF